MKTLAEVTATTGFEVLEHLEAETQVPIISGLQAQGDLFIIPTATSGQAAGDGKQTVPPDGIPVIEAVNGGHEHRLFAGTPATAYWRPAGRGGQDIGVLTCTQPAYILHPEHGAAGVAPGSYVLRRQREQAEEERLVAD